MGASLGVMRWTRNDNRKDLTTLTKQTVTVIGTGAVELVIPRVDSQVKELKQQRAGRHNRKNCSATSLSIVLMSMPGVGIKTAAIQDLPIEGVHINTGIALEHQTSPLSML